MAWLIFFFGILALIGWGFGKKGLRITLIALAVIIVVMLILLGVAINEEKNNSSSASSDSSSATDTPTASSSPTPTINPNPAWHMVYTTSGNNGDTSSSTFSIKGQQWRIDYTTSNDVGNLNIDPKEATSQILAGEGIFVTGISNTTKTEHTQPGQYYLDINSVGQIYSIKVEDYY